MSHRVTHCGGCLACQPMLRPREPYRLYSPLLLKLHQRVTKVLASVPTPKTQKFRTCPDWANALRPDDLQQLHHPELQNVTDMADISMQKNWHFATLTTPHHSTVADAKKLIPVEIYCRRMHQCKYHYVWYESPTAPVAVMRRWKSEVSIKYCQGGSWQW